MAKLNIKKYLIIIFLLSETGYIFSAVNSGRNNIPIYMYVYFESFVLFFLACFFLRYYNSTPQSSIKWFNKLIGLPKGTKNRMLLFVFAAGIVFRVSLFSSDITTSDDVYRYVWEGKAIVNGYNPYKVAPNSDELKLLHTRDYPSKVSFPYATAIYPPYSQLIFAASYLISGESFWGLKLFYLLSEIITMIFLIKILHLKGKDTLNLIYYAWLPLPILEFFGNVHLDPIGITFVVLFLFYVETKKYYLGTFYLAVSFLAKLYPVLLFPLLFKKLPLKKFVMASILFAIVSLIFYLPFLDKELSIFKFLGKYLANWQFNGSVFSLAKAIFNSQTARYICTAGLLISAVSIYYFYKDFINASYGIFLAIAIFATTLYPWYLGWLSALNVINPFYSIFSLAFTINLSNFTPLAPQWKEFTIVKLMEYIPFFILLAYDLRKFQFSNKNNAEKMK